jgi:hypothetical protein
MQGRRGQRDAGLRWQWQLCVGLLHSARANNTYAGVSYNKVSVRTVIWVPNHEVPIVGSIEANPDVTLSMSVNNTYAIAGRGGQLDRGVVHLRVGSEVGKHPMYDFEIIYIYYIYIEPTLNVYCSCATLPHGWTHRVC